MKTIFSTQPTPNSITEEQGQEIAARYDLSLDDMRADFNQANEYGQQVCAGKFSVAPELVEPMRLAHAGRYNDAAFLFDSYCAQMDYETRCADREYARYNEAAYGNQND